MESILLKEKIKLLDNSFNEKNNNIGSLKEEINVLNSIINEKDKIIKSLKDEVNK